VQFVNDPPIPNSQPVAIAPLKLVDVVVPGIRIGRNFLDLLHNPPLPIRGKPGQFFGKGFRGEHLVHQSIVTLGNNDVKQKIWLVPFFITFFPYAHHRRPTAPSAKILRECNIKKYAHLQRRAHKPPKTTLGHL
jgi:hypothetical protein